MDQELSPSASHPQNRDYIGVKHKPSEPPLNTEQKLQEFLPKDTGELSRDELHNKFMELSLRCFNKENQLSMSTELNKSYEKILLEQRVVIDTLEKSLIQSKEVLKSLVITSRPS